MKHDALYAQLQATYATLQAGAQQVLAMMVALEEDDVETRCPKCGSTDGVEAGRDALGRPIFVCVCGHNFAGADPAPTDGPTSS